MPDGMPLFIHTYGRPFKQTTFSWFGDDLRARTYFVVQEREAELWKEQRDRGRFGETKLLVLPDEIRTLSPTRQWILEYGFHNNIPRLVMMDDDLRFSHRKEDTGTKLHHSDSKDVTRMFDVLEAEIDLPGARGLPHIHAGISAREGNNHVEDSRKEVTRMMRILAYRPTEVLMTNARFDRIRTKQDFDMTLQLLRVGEANVVRYDFAQDQGGSQESGGCATYRTPAMMAEDAENLRALHPDFVKVVKKKTKGAWGGGERVDVTIGWKKAYQSSGAAGSASSEDE